VFSFSRPEARHEFHELTRIQLASIRGIRVLAQLVSFAVKRGGFPHGPHPPAASSPAPAGEGLGAGAKKTTFAVGFLPGENYHYCMTVPITAQIQRDGKWFVAFCPEFPEANGQGETQQECIESLKAAIELLLEDRREDARQKLPSGAELIEIRRSAANSSATWKPTDVPSSERAARTRFIGIQRRAVARPCPGTRRFRTFWCGKFAVHWEFRNRDALRSG